VISGFRHEATENCTLLDYCAASSGNFLPSFWNNLSVPSSGFKISFHKLYVIHFGVVNVTDMTQTESLNWT